MMALYIGLAGCVGALLRYGIGILLAPPAGSAAAFPTATLLINWVGAFVLAWLLYSRTVTARLGERWRTVIGTGVIGSFTTFSTFTVETLQLADAHAWGLAFLYVSLSIVGGMALARLGERLARAGRNERGRPA